MSLTDPIPDKEVTINADLSATDKTLVDENILTMEDRNSTPHDGTTLSSSEIVTHLTDEIITPMQTSNESLPSNGSIIITNEGIVWAPGIQI